jgi:hypothetical protein
MNTNRQILLIHATPAAAMPALADALRERGAEVKEMPLSNYDALLDALEQGWMPVVLKAPPT